MRRRRMQGFGSSFGSNPYEAAGEDVNPLAYLTNLADCMLVLACGFMVALVVAWSVDLPSSTEVVQSTEMTEVDNVEDITDQQAQGGNSYTELGKVYQDPNTGKMYMIKEAGSSEESSEESSSSDESAEASTSTSQTGTSTTPKAGSSSSDDSASSSSGQ